MAAVLESTHGRRQYAWVRNATEGTAMEFQFEMPDVAGCAARSCAYNDAGDCHARAITVGAVTEPVCDTYVETGAHVSHDGQHAGVGACKMSVCRHNDELECHAEHVRVSSAGRGANCLTFDAR